MSVCRKLVLSVFVVTAMAGCEVTSDGQDAGSADAVGRADPDLGPPSLPDVGGPPAFDVAHARPDVAMPSAEDAAADAARDTTRCVPLGDVCELDGDACCAGVCETAGCN